jgi:hypothetical protein
MDEGELKMRALGTLALVTVAAGAALVGTARPADATEIHHVVYEVWGDDATATVSWFDSHNNLTDDVDVALPWRIELDNFTDLRLYGVDAQTDDHGTIWCRITVDGQLRNVGKARGKWAIAHCEN